MLCFDFFGHMTDNPYLVIELPWIWQHLADFEAAGGCFSEFGHNWLSHELQYFVVIAYLLYIGRLKGDLTGVQKVVGVTWVR